MNYAAIHHQPKSEYAYAYDKSTLHLRLRTAKGDCAAVTAMAADPFYWIRKPDGTYSFDFDSVVRRDMCREYSDAVYDYWFCAIDGIPALRVLYGFVLDCADGKLSYGPYGTEPFSLEKAMAAKDTRNFFKFPFINEEDVFAAPAWVRDTVWYQIFPERFARGGPPADGILPWGSKGDGIHTDFFGGDLPGIIDRLDYIAGLGVTGIYFTPLFESPSTHKYNTTDYFKIDPQFGTNDDFRRLVKMCHSRGIRVMLDAVFNHCGYLHPFFQDVVKKGRDSQYWNCFHILRDFTAEDGKTPALSPKDPPYRSFAFAAYMPKWNTADPFTRDYLIDIGKHWVTEYGIDGWRLDVSNEVSHDFWRAFCREVRAVNPDTFILGENWDNAMPWLREGQFDSTMNYGFLDPLWRFVHVDYKDTQKIDAEEFKNEIVRMVLTAYPKNVQENLFNMIDCHDTARILAVCGECPNAVRVAYLIQMTFGGCPSVYYGGEIGLSGDSDGDAHRRCMIWDEGGQDKALLAFVKKLIALRREHPAARAVDVEWLLCDGPVLCYRKRAGDDCLTVAVNSGGEARRVRLPESLRGTKYTDLLTGRAVTLETELALPAHGCLLLN